MAQLSESWDPQMAQRYNRKKSWRPSGEFASAILWELALYGPMRPNVLYSRLGEAGEPISEAEMYQVLKQNLFVKRRISYRNVEYGVSPNNSAVTALLRQLNSLEQQFRGDTLDKWLNSLPKSDREGRREVTYAAVYTDLTELALIAVEYFSQTAMRRITTTYKPWVESVLQYDLTRLMRQRLTQLVKHLRFDPQSGNQAAADWMGEVGELRNKKLRSAGTVRPEPSTLVYTKWLEQWVKNGPPP